MTFDLLGNPVSYGARDAVAALDAAAEKLLAYRADPFADVEAILADHPRFVLAHCFRAGLIATATDRALDGELAKSLDAAQRLAGEANARERGHIAALAAWAAGDWPGAVELWGRILHDNPRDTMALQFAHVGDFFNGSSAMLRDRVAGVLPEFEGSTPRAGYVRGMYAFGLEETGDFGLAERIGRACVAANPQDAWAAHAVAHVLEMRGQPEAGIDWLTSTQGGWAPDNMFAYHNWWHLALYRLDREEIGEVLALYDRRIRPADSDVVLELIDATAMLWRLHARGIDVGDRFAPLAARWSARVDHGLYAFNDFHATMAFVGAGRFELARSQIATLRVACTGSAAPAAAGGLALAEGILAFGEGRHAACVDHLGGMRARAVHFGGSHAQRDIVAWTLVEAALRAGMTGAARFFAAQRLAAKPRSPINLAWARRAAGKPAVAA
jgi:tetratricopeptide (TPR) repeat protein